MCDYEVIEKNKAGVIVRDAAKVRCYNDGDETLFCARDLFTACKLNSVDAAIKRLERNVSDDQKAKVMIVRFPFCSQGSGWRSTNTYFINEYAFRSYMRGRYIQKDVKEWLISEVFTFKFDTARKAENENQIGLSNQLSETKADNGKADNVLELSKLLEKNGAAKIMPSRGHDVSELDEAVGKMVLAMLDVMKILVENRSSSECVMLDEKAAS